MAVRPCAGLRLRPVPELSTCLAFTPSPPRLHTLNPSAWLLAELCGRFEGDALQAAFLARTVPWMAADDAVRAFADGLSSLLRSGIVTETDGVGDGAGR